MITFFKGADDNFTHESVQAWAEVFNYHLDKCLKSNADNSAMLWASLYGDKTGLYIKAYVLWDQSKGIVWIIDDNKGRVKIDSEEQKHLEAYAFRQFHRLEEKLKSVA